MTEENVVQHSFTYFDVDGSYGCAHPDCIKVVDTTRFTDEDWQRISVAGDRDRMALALEIAEQRNPT